MKKFLLIFLTLTINQLIAGPCGNNGACPPGKYQTQKTVGGVTFDCWCEDW